MTDMIQGCATCSRPHPPGAPCGPPPEPSVVERDVLDAKLHNLAERSKDVASGIEALRARLTPPEATPASRECPSCPCPKLHPPCACHPEPKPEGGAWKRCECGDAHICAWQRDPKAGA